MLMKELKRDLQSMVKSLNELTEKTEKMIKRLEKLEKGQDAKKPKTKKAEKPDAKKVKKATATDTVFAIVKRSRKGIDTATLKKKTDFKVRSVENIIYRLKKQGKIKSAGRGLYVKA